MECANCGQEKELLPNGLCKECVKIISTKNESDYEESLGVQGA